MDETVPGPAPGDPAPDDPAPAAGVRRKWIVAGVAAGVLVLAGAGVGIGVAVSGPHGPQARAGRFLSSYEEDKTHSTPVVVRLPWGALSVSAGDPVSRIPESSECTDRTCDVTYGQIAPPSGGSWYPIAIKIDASLGGDELYRTTSTTTIPDTQVSLGSDGSWTPVAQTSGGGKATVATLFSSPFDGWIALPTTSDDLSVRVGFGGVTQTVDLRTGHRDAGLAEPLYGRQPSYRTHRCDRGTVPGYRETYVLSSECQLTGLTSVPYVAGLGWAASGRSWLVALLRTYPPGELVPTSGPHRHHKVYSDQDINAHTWRTTVRYGDVRPKVSANFNAVNTGLFQDPDDPDMFVFDVPSGDTGRSHTFTVRTRFRTSIDSHPSDRPLVITRTVRIG